MQQKFTFYIFDLFDGSIKGTDLANIANEFSSCEECIVLDTETGMQIIDGELEEIYEVGTATDSDSEEE